MNKDALVDCKKCGHSTCYEQIIPSENSEVVSWLCLTCGFTSSSIMKEGTRLDNLALESSPELYKALRFVDTEGFVWYPSTVTVPTVGMVFIDGKNVKDWKWCAARAVAISEEDRLKGNYEPEQTHKMDMKNSMLFGQHEFIVAMAHAGFLEE